jgi:nitrogen fixation-related uncharacterized protein
MAHPVGIAPPWGSKNGQIDDLDERKDRTRLGLDSSNHLCVRHDEVISQTGSRRPAASATRGASLRDD